MRLPSFHHGEQPQPQGCAARDTLGSRFRRLILGTPSVRHAGAGSIGHKASRASPPALPSPRSDSPHLTRDTISRSGTRTSPRPDRSPGLGRSDGFDDGPLRTPVPAHTLESRRSFVVEEGEQCHRERVQRRQPRQRRRQSKTQRRHWFSVLKVSSTRSLIISCVLSGIFLVTILSICK